MIIPEDTVKILTCRMNGAIRALEMARDTADLNERLRCLHEARGAVADLWACCVGKSTDEPPDARGCLGGG